MVCLCIALLSLSLYLCGHLSRSPTKPRSIYCRCCSLVASVTLYTAAFPVQEFFRGSLSKNPLYSTDILPSAGAAGSGSGDGGGAAGPGSSSTIGGAAEATMRNLRDKIATDLDMADAVRVLPLCVCCCCCRVVTAYLRALWKLIAMCVCVRVCCVSL